MKILLRILIGLCLIFGVTSAYAAGTIVASKSLTKGSGDYEFTYTCTADAADGSFPSTASLKILNGYVYEVVVNPGGTDASGVTPTALYDITLTDSDDIDIMGGQLANRSATESESAVPKNDGVRCDRKVNSKLTINITNNSVNSAVIIVKVRFTTP